MSKTERWKTIKEFPDYKISNHGKVYSFKKNSTRILKNRVSSKGYAFVYLTNSIGSKNLKVHRLVAQYFLSNLKNKEVVNHKDFNKMNNRVNNLEWMSNIENVYYSMDKDRYTKKRIKVICLETGVVYPSIAQTEKFTGVPHTTISRYLDKNKQIRGFTFRSLNV